MVVLDHLKPFYKVEFYDPQASELRSVFSPNIYLDNEKPSNDSTISTEVFISHITVNSKIDASVNTCDIEIRHGIGSQSSIKVGDQIKVYLGFYDQDKSQGPEFSIAFTGLVTSVRSAFEKSVITCKSSMKKIAKKKTKITFSRMMGINEIINQLAISIGGLELSQSGIFNPNINKQPGYGISEQKTILEEIKRLARYSAMDVYMDVFDKFHATPWDKSQLTTPSADETNWLSARGKNESENCNYYKHKILFDERLLDINFDITGDKYSGTEVVSFIPFSEEQAPTIDPVKIEYKPSNPDASKPLNRYKLSHLIREDAEKIAENLYKSDAGKIIGTLKLLSMPQIRVGDGIIFEGEGIEELPFNNIKFDTNGSSHQITDITFQVAEVQHKFDTVEGFVTNIKIIDSPATVGSTAAATSATGGAGAAAGAGIISTEAEFAGLAAEAAGTELGITISNAQWDKEEARQGDIVTLTADVEGAPDGTMGEIEIYEHDVDGIHDLIKKLPVVVTNYKVKTTWEYEYHEDTDEIPTEEELKKYGRDYNPPEYFFVVKIGDAEDQSGILLYKDYVEIILKNRSGEPIADEDFIFTLPDGSEIEGKVDSEGYAKVEGIPPGKVTVRFPNL